jgi:hypothetical protein
MDLVARDLAIFGGLGKIFALHGKGAECKDEGLWMDGIDGKLIDLGGNEWGKRTNYEHAVLDCRKLKDLLPNVRVEMMVGVRELPYPFTCVVEKSVADMRGLDEQLALEHRKLGLTDDEMGMRTIAELIGENQSLLRKETWQKDPELFGFSTWEE